MKRSLPSDYRGFGLLEILLGMALLGIMLMASGNLFGTSLRLQKRVELKDELVSIRRGIREQLDCTATLAGNLPCNPANYFDLKRKNGTSILPPNRKIASYELRASCDGIRLYIERDCPATALAAAGGSLCTGWGPLFPEGESACEGAFQVPPPCDPAASYCPGPMGSDGEYLFRTETLERSGPLETGIRTSQPTTTFGYCIKGSAATDTYYPGTSYREPNGIHWSTPGRAPIMCPAGYSAVGGGADCQVAPHGGITLSSAPYPDPVTKKPVGWIIDCCVFDGHLPRSPGGPAESTVSPKVGYAYVICLKD